MNVRDTLLTDLGLQQSDKVCLNCHYCMWLVGVGAGVVCSLKEGTIDERKIPGFTKSCSNFKSSDNSRDMIHIGEDE